MKISPAALPVLTRKAKMSLSDVTFEQGDVLPAFSYNGTSRVGYVVHTEKMFNGEKHVLARHAQTGKFGQFKVSQIKLS